MQEILLGGYSRTREILLSAQFYLFNWDCEIFIPKGLGISLDLAINERV